MRQLAHTFLAFGGFAIGLTSVAANSQAAADSARPAAAADDGGAYTLGGAVFGMGKDARV